MSSACVYVMIGQHINQVTQFQSILGVRIFTPPAWHSAEKIGVKEVSLEGQKAKIGVKDVPLQA